LRSADFNVGEARRIVDRDVDVLIADPALFLREVAMNAMADAADATERLDVEVQEVARARPLVPLNRQRRLEAVDAIQPSPLWRNPMQIVLDLPLSLPKSEHVTRLSVCAICAGRKIICIWHPMHSLEHDGCEGAGMLFGL
jgi:hypothetical protein